MRITKHWRRAYLILLLPLGFFLTGLASRYPELVERFYATGFFPLLGQGLNRLSGFVPFSLGEVGLLLFLACMIGYVVRTGWQLVRQARPRRQIMLRFGINILVIASVLYFGFYVCWGFNYYRLPFAAIAGLETQEIKIDELAAVCEKMIDRANTLRLQVAEDQNGVMQLAQEPAAVFDSVAQGYCRAAAIYPELRGEYGRPKGVLLSEALSYAGIWGIYSAFTGEANVNTDIPDAMLPSTACHEAAHQRGFAREDEANYIAYLTCRLNPHVEFQYSGTLLALIETMNTLYGNDRERFAELQRKYSAGVKRDLMAINRFNARYAGRVEEASRKANDLYLKFNRQKEGIASYNRMVDLLVAEYRATKNH